MCILSLSLSISLSLSLSTRANHVLNTVIYDGLLYVFSHILNGEACVEYSSLEMAGGYCVAAWGAGSTMS